MMQQNFTKAEDQILRVDRSFRLQANDWESQRHYVYLFDFEFHTMMVLSGLGSSREREEIVPFSLVAPELLEQMYEKLVELGGKPTPPGSSVSKPSFVPPKNTKGLNP